MVISGAAMAEGEKLADKLSNSVIIVDIDVRGCEADSAILCPGLPLNSRKSFMCLMAYEDNLSLSCELGIAEAAMTLEQGLMANATAMGELIRNEIITALTGHPALIEIRGKGLMLGIELNRDCTELVAHALGHGLLINVVAGNTIRLLPPLIINAEEAGALGRGVAELIARYH